MATITIERKLLEQALEALDGLEINYGNLLQSSKSPEQLDTLCTAIRAHLAQPQGEPVAWMHSKTGCLSESPYDLSLADGDEWAIPLYEHPAHTEAEVQEVIGMVMDSKYDPEPVVRRILGVPK